MCKHKTCFRACSIISFGNPDILWLVEPKNLRGYDALSITQEPSFTLSDAPYAPIKSLMLPRCHADTVLGPIATAVCPEGMDMGSPFLGAYR